MSNIIDVAEYFFGSSKNPKGHLNDLSDLLAKVNAPDNTLTPAEIIENNYIKNDPLNDVARKHVNKIFGPTRSTDPDVPNARINVQYALSYFLDRIEKKYKGIPPPPPPPWQA